MPNILEDLYYGNLSPCQRAVRPGSRVQKLAQKQSDLESKQNARNSGRPSSSSDERIDTACHSALISRSLSCASRIASTNGV